MERHAIQSEHLQLSFDRWRLFTSNYFLDFPSKEAQRVYDGGRNAWKKVNELKLPKRSRSGISRPRYPC